LASHFPGVVTLRIDPNATGPGLALRITKNQGEAIVAKQLYRLRHVGRVEQEHLFPSGDGTGL
jgi:hypothetical protein